MADDAVVLNVSGVSKKFTRRLRQSLSYGMRDVVAELCGGRRHTDRLRPGEFWALKDANLTLRRGTALGLVGPNGSGKTTLLRLISGLIRPDTGELHVNGTVAPLIALGAGFNPVLSGRENVFVNMALLGLTHTEILKRFDEVIDFAEIGDAIDAPVQTYSSGMAARLGFACAIHTTPDILLIDEVLSVGDMRFRSKCYRRLAEMKRKGTSFVLVSHSSNAITSICDTAVYLSGGRSICEGEPTEIVSRYERELLIGPGEQAATGALTLPEKSPEQSMGLDIMAVYLADGKGEAKASGHSGLPLRLRVVCKARTSLKGIGLWLIVRLVNSEVEPVLTLNSERDGTVFHLSEGTHELECWMPSCGLRPGMYTAKISVIQGSVYVLDAVESFRFDIQSTGDFTNSAYFQPRQWNAATYQTMPSE